MKKKLLIKIAVLIGCTLIGSTVHAYLIEDVQDWQKALNQKITDVKVQLITVLNQYEIENQLKTIDPRLATSSLTQDDLANLIAAILDTKDNKAASRRYRQPTLSPDAQTLLKNLQTSIAQLNDFYPNNSRPRKSAEQQIIQARNNVINQLYDRLVAIVQSYQQK